MKVMGSFEKRGVGALKPPQQEDSNPKASLEYSAALDIWSEKADKSPEEATSGYGSQIANQAIKGQKGPVAQAPGMIDRFTNDLLL